MPARLAGLLVVVCQLGCVGEIAGTGTPPGDARDDAPPTTVVAPCEVGGTFPALPPICIDGWCMDEPLGRVTAVRQTSTALWLALPTHAVRIIGQRVTSYPLPSAPVRRFIGSEATGLWALTEAGALMFDGAGWRAIAGSAGLTAIAPLSPTDAFAIHERGLFRFDGLSWLLYPLGPAFDWAEGRVVSYLALHASGTDVFVSVDVAEANQSHTYILHRAGTTWSVLESPLRAVALWGSSGSDIWISDGKHTKHYDGHSFCDHDEVTAEDFVGRGPHDLWAVVGGFWGTVSHWDGERWSSCSQSDLGRVDVSPGGDLWATRTDGTLLHHDGVAWSSTSRLSAASIHAIAGTDEVFALTNQISGPSVLRRDPATPWRIDPAIPNVGASSVASRSASDVWVYGVSAAHFDGTSWVEHAPPSGVTDLCIAENGDAFAVGLAGTMHFSGGQWTVEGQLFSPDLYCVGDDVWVAQQNYPFVAHRDPATASWTATLDEHVLGRMVLPPGGPLWSVRGELGRFDGKEWQFVERRGLESLAPWWWNDDASGTSGTDMWILFHRQDGAYLAHHDGAKFDRALAVGEAVRIAALAPDDVMLIGPHLAVSRMHGGIIEPLTGSIASASVAGVGTVWMASASSGLAVTDEGQVLAFDGTGWSRLGTLPGTVARGLVAFGADDAWTLVDGAALAHWTGTIWSTVSLPLQAGEHALDFWGLPSEQWIVTDASRILHVASGITTVFQPTIAASQRPTELTRVAGSSATDIWFGGKRNGTPALWHWNGSTFERYRTLRNVLAMRRIDGELYAAGHDELDGDAVWQRSDGRWVQRPDLDMLATFPSLKPPPGLPYGGIVSLARSDSGSLWAIGEDLDPPYFGTTIWRRATTGSD